jgi:hypothetical protein
MAAAARVGRGAARFEFVSGSRQQVCLRRQRQQGVAAGLFWEIGTAAHAGMHDTIPEQ